MIESISISSIATYATTPEQLNGLSQFNFLFGSNGTGKTTVSRVIADESSYPTCQVRWRSGSKLQPMVYNYDFVDRNFHQPAELKGVFTLGEKQKDTLANIATAKAELDALTSKIENLSRHPAGRCFRRRTCRGPESVKFFPTFESVDARQCVLSAHEN